MALKVHDQVLGSDLQGQWGPRSGSHGRFLGNRVTLAAHHRICSVRVQGQNVRNDFHVLCLLGQTQSEREMTVFVLVPKHCRKCFGVGG